MKRSKKPKDKESPLENQMLSRKPANKKSKLHGNTEVMISTGSTLLDLAISGTRVRGGGLPGGILVEAAGPSGTGKTVLLCEIAGGVQRQGGDTQFNDPEARLNKQFASIFDVDTDQMTIATPDTVTEVFSLLRDWTPKSNKVINGIFTDSLAALSTNTEMNNADGDKMGMRRAKEFSEGLRKFCRRIKSENYLMVCSNQLRVNKDAGLYGQKHITPGGESVGFYASVRLRFSSAKKIKKEVNVAGKKVTKVIGIISRVEVSKNSCDAPYRTADVYIQFDYGVDDVRANLQYLKDYTKAKTYELNGRKLGASMDDAICEVENNELEDEVKEAVIDLWEMIQSKFTKERKKKKR